MPEKPSTNENVDKLSPVSDTAERLKIVKLVVNFESEIKKENFDGKNNVYVRKKMIDILKQEAEKIGINPKSDEVQNGDFLINLVWYLFNNGYYFNFEANLTGSKIIMPMSIEYVDIKKFNGIQSLVKTHGILKMGIVDEPTFINGGQTHINRIVINMDKVRKDAINLSKLIPNGMGEINEELRKYLNQENEAWHVVFNHIFPQLINKESDKVRINGYNTTIKQTNEFLSDASNIISNKLGIIQVLQNICLVLFIHNSKLSIGNLKTEREEDYMYGYRYINEFLLNEIINILSEKGIKLEKLVSELIKERGKILNGTSKNDRFTLLGNMGKIIISTLGEDGLIKIQERVKTQAILSINALKSENMKYEALK